MICSIIVVSVIDIFNIISEWCYRFALSLCARLRIPRFKIIGASLGTIRPVRIVILRIMAAVMIIVTTINFYVASLKLQLLRLCCKRIYLHRYR